MGLIAVTGATIVCTCGMSPGTLNATSATNVLTGGKPTATIKDCAAGANITPMGLCNSMANPAVASATAAAMGVLTPQPCTPVTVGTWTPIAPQITVCSTPCLMQGSTLQCAYAGTISITNTGQVTVRN